MTETTKEILWAVATGIVGYILVVGIMLITN